MSFSGVQLGLLNKLEDPPANRRKPRQFATVDMTPSPATPYTVDFCMWLHRNFDDLAHDANVAQSRVKLTSDEYES